jgi:hypothetical protein
MTTYLQYELSKVKSIRTFFSLAILGIDRLGSLLPLSAEAQVDLSCHLEGKHPPQGGAGSRLMNKLTVSRDRSHCRDLMMSPSLVTDGSHLHRYLLSLIAGIGLVATPGKPVVVSNHHITARFTSPRLYAVST